MCGEHVTETDVNDLVRGSSPHVRGARVSEGLKLAQGGIIPACAGSTASWLWDSILT